VANPSVNCVPWNAINGTGVYNYIYKHSSTIDSFFYNLSIVSMNIYEVIFIIASILIGGGGTYYFVSQGQYIATILFLIGSILVLVIYGLLWFGPSGEYAGKKVPWPPVINTCPDYLTYFKRTVSGSSSPTDTCVDRTGVSKNGGITVFPPDGNSNSPDSCFFVLKKGASKADLCKETIAAGLTWEGITDGESCFNPAGGSTGPATGPAVPGANCPST